MQAPLIGYGSAFFREEVRTKGKCIGVNGLKLINLNMLVVWVFEMLKCSILQCLASKVGGLLPIQTLSLCARVLKVKYFSNVPHKRIMEPHNVCTDCNAKEDTTFHALMECIFERLFWISFNELYNVKLPRLHPLSWASDLLDAAFCKPGVASAIFLWYVVYLDSSQWALTWRSAPESEESV
jgi:hypothetical protein